MSIHVNHLRLNRFVDRTSIVAKSWFVVDDILSDVFACPVQAPTTPQFVLQVRSAMRAVRAVQDIDGDVIVHVVCG